MECGVCRSVQAKPPVGPTDPWKPGAMATKRWVLAPGWKLRTAVSMPETHLDIHGDPLDSPSVGDLRIDGDAI
jgi:hypothetical protein